MSDTSKKTWYVVLAIQKFSALEVMGRPLQSSGNDPQHFLSVFESMEAAEAWIENPDAQIITVETPVRDGL